MKLTIYEKPKFVLKGTYATRSGLLVGDALT